VVSAMIGTTDYFFLPDSIIYIPAGMLVGVIVCIISGLYPAWKASNMDPIDALRSESEQVSVKTIISLNSSFQEFGQVQEQ